MNPWISAIRLRTLPLSIAGIFTGGAMAYNHDPLQFKILVFLLIVITALLLQILSNFANDYGDFENGADNENRKGPKRTVQSGTITPGTMKRVILFTASITFISGLFLLIQAFDNIDFIFVTYLLTGVAGIAAAIKYTMGKKPYGYRGLGDVFVFVFFGLISSAGTFFLITQSFHPEILLPSIGIGAWSTAVLNLNNLRDIDSDKASGKITVPVRLGKAKGLIYHYILITLPFVCNWIYAILQRNLALFLLTGISLLPAVLLFKPLFNNPDHSTLDRLLKKTALFALLFTLLFMIGLMYGDAITIALL